VVRGARAGNDQLHGSGGQSSRSQEAEVRFGGLAEASFWTFFLGRMGFLAENLYSQTILESKRNSTKHKANYFLA